jgi:DNA-binding transcriptional regulator YdaS (Cro superfamily)
LPPYDTYSQRLKDIVTLAGSQANLAAFCGVEPYTVSDWVRNGISRAGALLIAKSIEFSGIVSSWDLHWETNNPEIIARTLASGRFKTARVKQLEFEASAEFSKISSRVARQRLKGA